MARAATTSDVFNAIAEPQRREILELLRGRERGVTEIADALGMSQPGASKHLRVLREVGLVHARSEGKQRLYGLDAQGLRPIHAWTGGFEEFWNESFNRLNTYVKELQRRSNLMTLTDESDREIVISRLIEGPRQVVFGAYSDVGHLSQWWGPDGFTTSTHSFDFRVGGAWDFVMHGPDGTDFPNYAEWLEITPPERLVMRHGERPADPDAFTQSITFEDAPGGTLVTMRAVFPTKERLDLVVREYGAIEGGHQHLARFNDYIRSIATGAASAS